MENTNANNSKGNIKTSPIKNMGQVGLQHSLSQPFTNPHVIRGPPPVKPQLTNRSSVESIEPQPEELSQEVLAVNLTEYLYAGL